MEKDQLINRINELARKKKEQGLSEEEIIEQQNLRQEYLEMFRANMKATLDNTVFMKEHYVKASDVTDHGMELLKNNDAIKKIELIDDKYEIYYDIKAITPNEIDSIINTK